MKLLAAALGACLAAVAAGAAASADAVRQGTAANNPLQKAITMLTDLQGKIIGDGERDQTTYDDYVRWCGKSALEKQHEIKDGTALKEQSQAMIDKAVSNAQDATSQIAELSGSIATDEADLKAATLLREKEAEDFEALDRELVSTIDTLARARRVLAKELQKAAGQSFLQRPTKGMQIFTATLNELVTAAGVLSLGDRTQLAALLEDQQRGVAAEGAAGAEGEGDDGALDNPNAPSYSTHSGGILEALEDLQDKVEVSQTEARSKETSSRHNYDGLRISLQGKLSVQNKELAEAKKQLARAAEVKAQADKELEECVKNLQEAQKMLENLQRDCMNRAADFSEEVVNRKAEMDALAIAKKAVQDSMISTAGKAYLLLQDGAGQGYSLLQAYAVVQQGGQGYSFLQVSMQPNIAAAASALRTLRRLAQQTGSLALAQLASRATSAARVLAAQAGRAGIKDPFVKVKHMIQDMLGKLEREAKEEAGQKEFCDREISRTQASQADNEDKLTELSTRLETSAAEVAKLQEEIKTLSSENVELAKNQAEMDRIRREDQASNLQAKTDFEQGLEAVQVALKTLRDYYGGNSRSAAALEQEDVSASMAAETGRSDSAAPSAGHGIIALLEIVESDFAKGLTEAQTSEQAALDAYQKVTQENKIAKATSEKEVQYKGEEVTRLRKLAAQLASDRAEVQNELDAINEYFSKLKPQCIQQPESFGERAKRRKVEIDGLKEALATLQSSR